MSNSSQRQARIYRESAWGETPSTGNKMTDLNITGESISQQTNTQRSQNIRSDGNTSSVNRTGVTAGGDLQLEMNFGSGLDLLFEGVMRNTFGTDVGITAQTTIAAVATGNKITDSGAGLTNAVVGQWIEIRGFATAGNNGYFKVTAKASNSEITVSGATLVDETAGESVTIKGTLLKNGVSDQSFLVEVESDDINIFKYMTGGRVGQTQFNFAPNSLVTGSVNFRGKQMFTDTVTQGDGSPNAAATTRSMNSVDNIKGVFKDGSATTFDITNFTFAINPALRDQPALGNLANVGIGSGTLTAQITMEVYLEDKTLIDEYLAFTESDTTLVIEDVAGNAYIFDFPAIVPANGEDPTGGLDQDVLFRGSYEAFLDTSLNGTVGITKVAA